MNFKTYIDSPCGLRYMLESLNLLSPCSRRVLLECELMRDRGEIEQYYDNLRDVYGSFIANEHKLATMEQKSSGCCTDIIKSTNGKGSLARLEILLPMVREIWGTIVRLASDAVLDDIELFEIKSLSIVSEQVRDVLLAEGICRVKLHSLSKVIDILDPDKNNVLSFYIYDSYSEELRAVRARVKALNTLKECEGFNEEQMAEYISVSERMEVIEGEIREKLSGRLREFASELEQNLMALAQLDILLAKAKQIGEMGLCMPTVSSCKIGSFRGLFHPAIKMALANDNKEFTPIDIEFSDVPVTIIGANMGGKTVVLKMVALSQLLFQFGFGVPAESALLSIRDEVMICIGDDQNEIVGLSSFGAEIKAIDAVIKEARGGANILALIDEPARTTNPVEGTALVSALLKVLSKMEISLLLTTHYNIEEGDYKRLRVNGLVNGEMDYRLKEVVKGEIPQEAISIAASLGVDSGWIDAARGELNNGTSISSF